MFAAEVITLMNKHTEATHPSRVCHPCLVPGHWTAAELAGPSFAIISFPWDLVEIGRVNAGTEK